VARIAGYNRQQTGYGKNLVYSDRLRARRAHRLGVP
jgi:hypothetical protein